MKKLVLKRSRLNFDELRERMEAVRREEQRGYIGGYSYGGASIDGEHDEHYITIDGQQVKICGGTCAGTESCVFNCFDYLDGDLHDANYYYEQTKNNLGYVPNCDGGVYTSDISKIGAFGGFNVIEAENIRLVNGRANGYRVMMTFNDGPIDRCYRHGIR